MITQDIKVLIVVIYFVRKHTFNETVLAGLIDKTFIAWYLNNIPSLNSGTLTKINMEIYYFKLLTGLSNIL